MRIHVNKKMRIAEIWLTKAESEDPEVEEKLKPFYQECKAHKYLAAVFHSGHEDLFESTRDLICHNYNNCVNPLQVCQGKTNKSACV